MSFSVQSGILAKETLVTTDSLLIIRVRYVCVDHRVSNRQLIRWFLTHKYLYIPSVSVFVNTSCKPDGFIEHVH